MIKIKLLAAWGLAITPLLSFCQLPKTINDLFTLKSFELRGAALESVFTGIRVSRGDFVYFQVSGKISLGFWAGSVFADGTANPLFAKYNKYEGANHGAVMCKIGGDMRATTRILDPDKHPVYGLVVNPEYLVSDGVSGSYIPGAYFLSEADGEIVFDLNDMDRSNNSGVVNIAVITMRESNHYSRNLFNRCPLQEPGSKGDETPTLHGEEKHLMRDCQQENWIEEPIYSNFYHGDVLALELNDSFRGAGDKNRGCQCVYADDKLVTGHEHQGSFDIGFWLAKSMDSREARHLHLILDMLVHDLYIEKNGETRLYTGTEVYCK